MYKYIVVISLAFILVGCGSSQPMNSEAPFDLIDQSEAVRTYDFMGTQLFLLKRDEQFCFFIFKEGAQYGEFVENVKISQLPTGERVLGSFLVLFYPKNADVFTIIDGHLTLLNTIPIYNENIKLSDGHLQTALFEVGWTFQTWQQLDNQLVMIDETIYNESTLENGIEIGKYYFDLWENNEKYVLPYKNLELNVKWLSLAAIGKLPGCELQIGESREKLLSLMGEPFETGSYEGGNYYAYSGCMFIFEPDNETIGWIVMNGNRIKATSDQVGEFLGAAQDEWYNEMTNKLALDYFTGGNILRFYVNEMTDQVNEIWLLRK